MRGYRDAGIGDAGTRAHLPSRHEASATGQSLCCIFSPEMMVWKQLMLQESTPKASDKWQLWKAKGRACYMSGICINMHDAFPACSTALNVLDHNRNLTIKVIWAHVFLHHRIGMPAHTNRTAKLSLLNLLRQDCNKPFLLISHNLISWPIVLIQGFQPSAALIEF